MTMKRSPSFIVRPDGDGTFLLFCPTCFLTVARAKAETEFGDAGRGHKCPGPPVVEFVRRPWELDL
jgi:hypothetical protein